MPLEREKDTRVQMEMERALKRTEAGERAPVVNAEYIGYDILNSDIEITDDGAYRIKGDNTPGIIPLSGTGVPDASVGFPGALYIQYDKIISTDTVIAMYWKVSATQWVKAPTRGAKGDTGARGISALKFYRAVVHGNAAPAVPTVSRSGQSFTASGWTYGTVPDNFVDAATNDLYEIIVTYDWATGDFVQATVVVKVDGDTGVPGLPGTDGITTIFAYQTAATAPDTLTGGTPETPPEGISYTPTAPTAGSPVWIAQRRARGGSFIDSWSAWRQFSGTDGKDGVSAVDISFVTGNLTAVVKERGDGSIVSMEPTETQIVVTAGVSRLTPTTDSIPPAGRWTITDVSSVGISTVGAREENISGDTWIVRFSEFIQPTANALYTIGVGLGGGAVEYYYVTQRFFKIKDGTDGEPGAPGVSPFTVEAQHEIVPLFSDENGIVSEEDYSAADNILTVRKGDTVYGYTAAANPAAGKYTIAQIIGTNIGAPGVQTGGRLTGPSAMTGETAEITVTVKVPDGESFLNIQKVIQFVKLRNPVLKVETADAAEVTELPDARPSSRYVLPVIELSPSPEDTDRPFPLSGLTPEIKDITRAGGVIYLLDAKSFRLTAFSEKYVRLEDKDIALHGSNLRPISVSVDPDQELAADAVIYVTDQSGFVYAYKNGAHSQTDSFQLKDDTGSADLPNGVVNSVKIAKINNQAKAFLARIDGGIPSGDWSISANPTGANSVKDMLILDDKIMLLDSQDGIYYRRFDAVGNLYGSWAVKALPTGAASPERLAGTDTGSGYMLFLIDETDGPYYLPISYAATDLSGDFTHFAPPYHVNPTFFTAQVYEETLFMVNVASHEIFSVALSSTGIPEGSWSAPVSGPPGGPIYDFAFGFNRIFITTVAGSVYSRELNGVNLIGSWTDLGSPPEDNFYRTLSYITVANNKVYGVSRSRGISYIDVDSDGNKLTDWSAFDSLSGGYDYARVIVPSYRGVRDKIFLFSEQLGYGTKNLTGKNTAIYGYNLDGTRDSAIDITDPHVSGGGLAVSGDIIYQIQQTVRIARAFDIPSKTLKSGYSFAIGDKGYATGFILNDNVFFLVKADGSAADIWLFNTVRKLILTGSGKVLGSDANGNWSVITGGGGGLSPTQLAKLNGIESGAQKNPPHVVSFRTEDGNAVAPGITHFYKSDNSQWQSGSSTQIAAIEISPDQFTLTENPQSPVNPAGYRTWAKLADDIIENGGMSIWTFQRIGNSDPSNTVAGSYIQVQVDSVTKNSDGNYVLGSLVHLHGFSQNGQGYNWQVVGVYAPPTGADSIIGVVKKNTLPSDTVYKEQLEGKEVDRYASYSNAFFALGDRRGAVCFFTGGEQPTDDTNAVRQPDIVDNSSMWVAFGATLRTDKDPNHLVYDEGNAFSSLTGADKLYFSIWNKPSARAVATLLGAPVVKDTGNARYYLAQISLDEVEDISNVTQDGDYMRITDYEPTDIDIRIPVKDVIGALSGDGTELDDSTLTGDTELITSEDNKVKVSEIYEHHDQNHTGLTNLTGYTFKTGTSTPNAGDVAAPAPSGGSQTGVYYIKPLSDDDKALIKNTILADKRVRFQVSATRYIEFKPNSTPGELSGRLFGNFSAASYIAVGTALTNNTAVGVEIESNIPGRDEFSDVAFTGKAEDVSVDASGFDGNLASTDNTVQKVAQKVDDLNISGGGGGGGDVTGIDAGTGIRIDDGDTATPEVNIADGGVGTTQMADASVTPAKADAGTDTKKAAWRTRLGIPNLFNRRGTYANNTAYAVGDVVAYSSHLYYVATAVPNTNTTAPADGTTWVLLSADPTPDATETVAGKVERATNAEAQAGTDTTKYMSPKQVKDYAGGFSASDITGQTEAVAGDGDLRMVGAKTVKVNQVPVAETAKNMTLPSATKAVLTVDVGGVIHYIALFNDRGISVKVGDGSWGTKKTNVLNASNTTVNGVSYDPVNNTVFVGDNGTTKTIYLYAYDSAAQTLTAKTNASFTVSVTALEYCLYDNGSLWVGDGTGTTKHYTIASTGVGTYDSTKDWTHVSGIKGAAKVGSLYYLAQASSRRLLAFNASDRTANSAYQDTTINTGLSQGLFTSGDYLFVVPVSGTTARAYKVLGDSASLVETTVPQSALVPFTGKSITDTAESDERVVRVPVASKGQQRPVYDSSKDYAQTGNLKGATSFVYGGVRYVLVVKTNSRSLFVKKDDGAFTEKTNQLQSANNNPHTITVSISGDTISVLTTQDSSVSAYVYTYNTSNDTLTYVATRSLNNTGNYSAVFVMNGSSPELWIGEGGVYEVQVYDTDATFSTLTYSSSKSFSVANSVELSVVGEFVYGISNLKVEMVRKKNREYAGYIDFAYATGNSNVDALYTDDTHIYLHDRTDGKWYAYRWWFGEPELEHRVFSEEALKPDRLVYSSASEELDSTYENIGTDLLANTDGSLIITVAYDANGSNQYIAQTVRMPKSRITTTEQRIPVVASVVGADQSWALKKSGNNLQMRMYGIAADRSIIDIYETAV